MNATGNLERRISDYYASEAPSRAPDRVLGMALATIDTTAQTHALVRVPWRFSKMQGFSRLAIAAVAVIAVGAVGLIVFGGRTPNVGGSTPGPATAVPSPSPAITAVPADPTVPPALTELFTSTIHGVSISHPRGWSLDHVATEAWTTGIPYQEHAFADVISAMPDGFLLLASQSLAGKSGEDWAAGIAADPDWNDGCQPTTKPTRIDGAPALIVERCDGTRTAVAWVADRGYLFVLYDNDELFERMLVTVRLSPGSAITPSPSPAPPGG